MAGGPIRIVQPFNAFKVHNIRFHTKARSANNKNYSCGVIMKRTTEGDSSGVNYYRVLEDVLKVEYLGELTKHCVLFHMIGSTHQTLKVHGILR